MSAASKPTRANGPDTASQDRKDAPAPSPQGRRTTAGFRREERIRRHADFQRVYKQGLRVPGRYATLFLLHTGEAVGRLGVSATRKLGGAVRRNRAKRLIRDMFRRHKVGPGFDLVVVPTRQLFDAGMTAIETEYKRNLERGLRQSQRPR